jgi:hypothetical protein
MINDWIEDRFTLPKQSSPSWTELAAAPRRTRAHSSAETTE